MTEFTSVLELAQEVTRQATRIQESSALEIEVKRVLLQTDETRAELGRLEKAVKSARALLSYDSAAAVDLSGLDTGLEAFARNAASRGDLPTRQAFSGAQAKIREVTSRVNGELAQAWSGWTNQRMGSVPMLSVSLLPPADQTAAWDRWNTLQKLSKVGTPEPSDLTMAQNALSYLHEALKDIPPPPSEVAALVDRLGKRPFLTLADLTDEQINALREAKVAVQFELRRRGA